MTILLSIFILLCVIVLTIVLVSQKKKKKKINRQLIALFAEYKRWNNLIVDKEVMREFYGHLSKTPRRIGFTDFCLNVSEADFDRLNVSNLRALNDEALANIIRELHN